MFLDLKQTHCFQGLMWTVLLVLNFVFSWCLRPFQCQSSRQDPVDRKHVGQGQWDDHWWWNGLYLSQDHREDGGQWLSWRKRKCMLSLFRIHLSSSHLISQCSGLIRLGIATLWHTPQWGKFPNGTIEYANYNVLIHVLQAVILLGFLFWTYLINLDFWVQINKKCSHLIQLICC